MEGHISVGGSSQASLRNCSLKGNLSTYTAGVADFRNCSQEGVAGFDARIDVGDRSSLTLRNGSSHTIAGINVNQGDLHVRNGTSLSCVGGAGSCDIYINTGLLNIAADFDGNRLQVADNGRFYQDGGTITLNEFSVSASQVIGQGGGALEFGGANADLKSRMSFYDGYLLGCKGSPGNCNVWISDSTLEVQSGFHGNQVGLSSGSVLKVENYSGNLSILEVNELNVNDRSEAIVGRDGKLKANGNLNVGSLSVFNLTDLGSYDCAVAENNCQIYVSASSRILLQSSLAAEQLQLSDGSTGEIVNWSGGTPELNLIGLNLNTNSVFSASDGSVIKVENTSAIEGSVLGLSDTSTFICPADPGSCNVWLEDATLNLDTNMAAQLGAEGSSLYINAELTLAQLNASSGKVNVGDNGRIDGEVYCTDGCRLNAWNGEITGEVRVHNNSNFDFGDNLTLGGPINISSSSSLNMAQFVNWGAGVPGLWGGGPILRFDGSSNGSLNGNNTIGGSVYVDNGSSLGIGDNSSIGGELAVNYRSNAGVQNNVTVDSLQGSESSSIHIDGILTVVNSAFLSGGSQIALRDNASLNLTNNHLFMEQGSHLNLSNNSTFGRANSADQAVGVGDFSTVEIKDSARINGTLQLGDWAQVRMRGNGVEFNGNIEMYSEVANNAINFGGSSTIMNGHSVACSGAAMSSLTGTTPTLTGGSIAPGCNDLSAP
ncbi:MAG: hypothetical protein ACI8P9_000159 [Parasphingorhabdus sp.]|jgi:hypothetical protein